MRMTTTLAIATAALLASAPAVAQNETAVANTVDNAVATNTTDMNAVGTTTTTDMNTTTETQTAAIPVDNNYQAPAPEKKGFPWGVLGLLGLLGLIPRARRNR